MRTNKLGKFALLGLALAASPAFAVAPHGHAPGPSGPAVGAPPATLPPTGDPGTGEPVPGTPQPEVKPKPPAHPLRIGITTWIAHAPALIANGGLKTAEGSIYKKLGIDVELVLIDDPAAARVAFAKGEVDLVTTTLDAFTAEGPTWGSTTTKGRIVLLESWSHGADGLVVTGDVAGIEDFAKAKVATIDSPAPRFMLGYLLEAAGVTGTVTLSRLNDGVSVKDAFRKGEVVGAMVWEPYLTAALADKAGSRKLITTVDAPNLIADVLVAREETLSGDHDRVQKLIDGWYQGLAELQKSPKTAMPKVAAALSVDAPDATDWLSHVTLAPAADLLALVDPAGGKSRFERLASAANRILRPGSKLSDPATLVDASFVKAVPAAKKDKAKPAAEKTGALHHLLRMARAVTFAHGTDTPDATAEATLEAALDLLQLLPGAHLRLEPAGSGRGALPVIGKQRAAAIVKTLTEKGIAPSRFLPAAVRAAQPGGEDTVWISIEL